MAAAISLAIVFLLLFSTLCYGLYRLRKDRQKEAQEMDEEFAPEHEGVIVEFRGEKFHMTKAEKEHRWDKMNRKEKTLVVKQMKKEKWRQLTDKNGEYKPHIKEALQDFTEGSVATNIPGLNILKILLSLNSFSFYQVLCFDPPRYFFGEGFL